MAFTPYATGKSLFGQKPSYLSDSLDQERLQSYELYEAIYWNVPETFKLTQRGTNDQPIYIPSARTIIDAINRYVAPDFTLNIHARGDGVVPDTDDVVAARLAMTDLWARERFRSKFNGAKRYCTIQGDWIWHVTADPAKPVGSRLSLNTVDPSMYFPQFDPDNIDRVEAVFLATPVTMGDDNYVRRVCYRRVVNGENTTITVEEGLFKTDEWESLDAKPQVVTRAVSALPPEITTIPVYHVKGFEEPGNPFGSSAIRGFESLMAAVNQVVSDEDLALALDGIGMYATTAPQPIDPSSKKPVPWQLGPGRVVHYPQGETFARISGVDSVLPYGDHYGRLWEAMKQAAGTPDVAVGTVDVQIAQSGIALALQLSPIIAQASEKNELIVATHNQMFYDIINMWYAAYEETVFVDVVADCVPGSAIPEDRAARFTELNDMLDRKVIDAAYYRSEAAKLGYVFPDDIGTRIADAIAADAAVQADAFATRVNTELTSGGDSQQ
jgi:hypothetical protein